MNEERLLNIFETADEPITSENVVIDLMCETLLSLMQPAAKSA